MNHRQVSDEKAKYHLIKSIAAILLRPKTIAISPLLPPNGRPQEMRAAQLLRRCGLRLVSAIAGIIVVPPAAAGIHSRVRRPRRALGLREANRSHTEVRYTQLTAKPRKPVRHSK